MQKVQVHLAAENSQNTTTLVTNTRVFDGTQFLDGTFDVLFDNSTISSIEKAGTGATADTMVDGTGSTLLPGLIDAHVHLSDVEQLVTFAAHGVTTVLDMGIWDPKFVQELRATTSGAHVYASGAPLAGANGGHQHILGFPADSLIADVEQGIQAVNQRATEGANYLKLILDPEDENGMTAELATALVNAVHEQGLLVIAHTTDLFSYEVGLAAGVDIFTHVPLGEALDENIAPRVKLAIPTITMMQEIAYTNGCPLDGALDSVQELVRGGARIMAGTDANDADGVPANVTLIPCTRSWSCSMSSG